jgi:hypothetical protein
MTQRTQDRAPRIIDWSHLIETGADATSLGERVLEDLCDSLRAAKGGAR